MSRPSLSWSRLLVPGLLLASSPLVAADGSIAPAATPAAPASAPASSSATHSATSPAIAGAPPASTTATPAQPAPAPAPPRLPPPSPFLGVTVDRPANFDADDGLLVTAVVPQATFDHLGVRSGDRLLTANGTQLHAISDLSAIADHLQVGQLLTMTVRTDTAIRTVSGRIEAVSRPREISEHTQQLSHEIEQLRDTMGQKEHSSLEQTLTVLRQIEADLPGMLDTFKQRYPHGKFAVSIHIDILSDETAEHSTTVPLPQAPHPPTPATPPQTSSNTGTGSTQPAIDAPPAAPAPAPAPQQAAH